MKNCSLMSCGVDIVELLDRIRQWYVLEIELNKYLNYLLKMAVSLTVSVGEKFSTYGEQYQRSNCVQFYKHSSRKIAM